MIKEIEKPNINFKFAPSIKGKFYFDEENNEYFIKNEDSIVYFNLNGFVHRIGKPARLNEEFQIFNYLENGKLHRDDGYAASCCKGKHNYFYLNGKHQLINNWTEKTNHLVCKFCNKFCKQKCF